MCGSKLLSTSGICHGSLFPRLGLICFDCGYSVWRYYICTCPETVWCSLIALWYLKCMIYFHNWCPFSLHLPTGLLPRCWHNSYYDRMMIYQFYPLWRKILWCLKYVHLFYLFYSAWNDTVHRLANPVPSYFILFSCTERNWLFHFF